MQSIAQVERLSDREFREDMHQHEQQMAKIDHWQDQVDARSDELYNKVLNDCSELQTLDDDYEVFRGYSSQFARAIRNLDKAIKGDEVSRDAVFTALSIVQSNLRNVCEEIAAKEIKK